jgi:hypothetical protein
VSKAPGVYLGEPDDLTTVAVEVMRKEGEGWDALYRGDGPRALMPGGKVAGRIDDLPSVKKLVRNVHPLLPGESADKIGIYADV